MSASGQKRALPWLRIRRFSVRVLGKSCREVQRSKRGRVQFAAARTSAQLDEYRWQSTIVLSGAGQFDVDRWAVSCRVQFRITVGPVMTFAPLFEAPALVQFHAYLAMAAVLLGGVQLFAPKGTIPHRTVGWVWALLVAVMLVTAFMNHDILSFGPFSPKICCRDLSCRLGSTRCGSIHILSVFVLLLLPFAILQARLRNLLRHRQAMIILMAIMVLGAGFTFLPTRIMHAVAFGG
jgi:uncharacterized membrane protein